MDLVRGLNPAQIASLKSSCFFPNLMVSVEWPGDPLHFHLGERPIEYGGDTYSGFGPLASISFPQESYGISAVYANLSIVGVTADLSGQIDQPIRNYPVVVYGLLMTSQGSGVPIGPPFVLFQGVSGRTSLITKKVSESEITNAVELEVSTGPSARAKSTVYHSNEDQISKYPTDTAGRLVILSYAKAQKLRWPE